MKPKDLTGAVIDRFTYDTPDQVQADFYQLCDNDKPLVLVFLPNCGHPISRVYLTRYMESIDKLTSGRLACVVRSDSANIATKLEARYPFPLICDAAGALYEYFGVQSTTSRMAWSFMAVRIFREAKKQGFQLEKNPEQILPLTLVIGRGGQVLFSHYGESLTDLPEDCEAMERVCSKLMVPAAAEPVETADPQPETAEVSEEDQPAPDQEPEATDAEQDEDQLLFLEGDVDDDSAKEADTDHTQQIDLSGWLETDLAPDADTDDDEDELETAPRWNRLLGFFADRDKRK